MSGTLMGECVRISASEYDSLLKLKSEVKEWERLYQDAMYELSDAIESEKSLQAERDKYKGYWEDLAHRLRNDPHSPFKAHEGYAIKAREDANRLQTMIDKIKELDWYKIGDRVVTIDKHGKEVRISETEVIVAADIEEILGENCYGLL